jgi:hypothetical protein
MIEKLYSLFFEEAGSGEAQGNEDDAATDMNHDNEEKKMKKIRMDQDLLDFEERGGLTSILKEIFNPRGDHVELDAVYQLKNLCRTYYEKKGKISKELVESLDALLNERPNAFKMKKKHFFIE